MSAIRIWVMHCPFRKTGSPVLGTFGQTIQPVVIMHLDTWKRLMDEVPALKTTHFEMGTFNDEK